MSQTLSINGVEFISASQAGKQFGYTRDYMLTLAREGKIDGQKIGNRWYINPVSAKDFFARAEVEREERRRTISLERKAELRQHVEVDTGVRKHVAFAETFAVLVLGLSLGLLGYLSTDRGGVLSGASSQSVSSAVSSGSFFEDLAVSFYEFISPSKNEMVLVTTPVESLSDDPIEEDVPLAQNAKGDQVTPSSLVVFPESSLSSTSVAEIQASFSDDVTVTFDTENPDMGLIVPHFKNTEREAYRFLMVPSPDPGG